MIEIVFRKLVWPKGLNLGILEEIMKAENPTNFIVMKSMLDRKHRRIILPSWRTFVKVLCHYLWGLVEEKVATWDEVKAFIQNHFGTVENLAVSRFQVKRLYAQREKEIKDEK